MDDVAVGAPDGTDKEWITFGPITSTVELVNAEMRADVEQLVRDSTPELNLRRIDWIFEAREQMIEFNVPPQLALEAMMVALKVPGRGE